ncbi:hypothetical protein OAW64_00310 [Flavobacteriales bacterium]|jgi:hypothetical protein|nr:hypothetical protein [Flavobacteriales bacterium]
MKKNIHHLSLILISFSFFTFAYSQDTLTKKNNWISFEGQIYPSVNNDAYQPKLKIRVNFNKKSVLRFNTDFTRSEQYQELSEVNGPGVGSVKKINSMFLFSIGYESQKRFENSLIYSGLEGVLGFGRNNEYGSRTDSIIYVSDLNYNFKKPVQNLGLRMFFGGEYYIKSNIYIGTEFGIMLLKTTYRVGEYNVIDDSSLTSSDETVEIPKTSSSGMFYSGLGSIRIGFVFK